MKLIENRYTKGSARDLKPHANEALTYLVNKGLMNRRLFNRNHRLVGALLEANSAYNYLNKNQLSWLPPIPKPNTQN